MYVVIFVSTNKMMMMALKTALKEQFSLIEYTLRENVDKVGEFQIRLEGTANEDKSLAFARGFSSAWKD